MFDTTSSSKNKSSDEDDMRKNDLLIRSKECIQRMEVASFRRFAFMKRAMKEEGINRLLLFFTPCEELAGGSIFTKLSFDFNVIQPYVEQIDAQFLEILNLKIRNIHYFVNSSSNS